MKKCKYDVKTNTMISMCEQFKYAINEGYLGMSKNGNGASTRLKSYKNEGQYITGIDYCPWCGEAISNSGILDKYNK